MNDDFVESVWQEIRTHLEDAKREIYAEITSYPPPIPACDVQFNHLLERCGQVARELQLLDAALDKPFSNVQFVEWLDEFVRDSSFIDEVMTQQIQSRLTRRTSEA